MRSSWSHRQALAIRDAQAMASSREGSSNTVKPPLSVGAQGYLYSLKTQSIVDLITAKYEPTKNDMMAGSINGALENWLEKRPAVACELHAKVLENLSELSSSLLSNAIVALSKSDYEAAVEMAKADARSDLLMQAEIGTWTLGRLLLDVQTEPEAINVVVEAVANLVESEHCEIRSQAIRAAVGAMHKMAAFDALTQRLAESGDQVVLCAAARALFLKSEEIRERGITKYWLQVLTELKPEFRGAIRDLDHALSQLISDPEYSSIVLSTLSQWVANHGQRVAIDSDTAEFFGDTLRKLLPLEVIWSSLVTDWLLSDRQEHAAALAGILNQLSAAEVTKVRFDKSRLDELSTNDLMFLARRMLGYVHDRAQLTSLAISMLESTDVEKRIFPLLRAVFVDEIGYDYPVSTVKALRDTAEEESSAASNQDFLKTMADAISQATEIQNALPAINELRPPTKLRRLFQRARAKQMNDSFEEANKNSIWRQIATQIPIKAGTAMAVAILMPFASAYPDS